MTEAADPIAEAIAYEEAIAAEATEIRGDETDLTPALFLKLWPLLKRPIPAGFIQTVGKVQGKPYESTGIRSVQVQIDRMNNVLTPLGWTSEVEYEQDGKLARVTIGIGRHGNALAHATSYGGVDRGSGVGNIYKGSYTNAAKIAFARLGPGHEVYLGAADLDPDTNEDAAKQAAAPGSNPEAFGGLPAERVEALGTTIRKTLALPAERVSLLIGSVGGNAPEDPDDNGQLRVALGGLTPEQADALDAALASEADREVAKS